MTCIHLPHTSATCRTSIYCPLILPQLLFFQRFLTCQVCRVGCGLLCLFAFHCLNKKLKWHLSHSFTKTWLSYPVSTLLLLDYRLHFWKDQQVSVHGCAILQGCDSSPICSSFRSAWWIPERGLGCFVRPLFVAAPPPHPAPLFYCSLESETWAEPALAGWQFLLICDRFLDK